PRTGAALSRVPWLRRARSDTAQEPPEPRQRPPLPAREESLVHLDDDVREVRAVGLVVAPDQRAQELFALVARLLADGAPAGAEPVERLRYRHPLPAVLDDGKPQVPVFDAVERIPAGLLPAHTPEE